MSNPSNQSSQEQPQRCVVLALPAISNTSLRHRYGLGRRGGNNRNRSRGRDDNQSPSNGGRGRGRGRGRSRSPSHSNGGREPPFPTINTEEHLTMQIESPSTIINREERRAGDDDRSRGRSSGHGRDDNESPSNGGRGRGRRRGRGRGGNRSRSRSPSHSNGGREPPTTTLNTEDHLTMQIEPPSTIINRENGTDANDNVVAVNNIESDCKIDETVPPKTDEEILEDEDDIRSLLDKLPIPSMFYLGF
ncbi:hypothetical protein ISN45_At01g062810 [Arabidopsis thaliana x Arabidopsis arenosa]|uniref:Uncharacterized protein n=1 Tax=Arabidopsis thaliana x Arabidopsis arenosa TaxID=1240361 RepID=A0A8T2GVR6_9BRAS|nr:hypothetical protein ISN45_At01g062810 [Arabidopsis thaliana x Arabidopsis arenosa]